MAKKKHKTVKPSKTSVKREKESSKTGKQKKTTGAKIRRPRSTSTASDFPNVPTDSSPEIAALESTGDAPTNAGQAESTDDGSSNAGQIVTCAGYSLEVANQFGVITDKFDLQVLDAQQNRFVAQGSLFDQRSRKLLQRIAQANFSVGWTVKVINGVIVE